MRQKVLEKCAIEDSGKILCGDCVVLNTDKEVQETERIIKQQRKEEYELERKHILKKTATKNFLCIHSLLYLLSIHIKTTTKEQFQTHLINFSLTIFQKNYSLTFII